MTLEIPKPIIAFREWCVEGDLDLLAPRHGHVADGKNPWNDRHKAVAWCRNAGKDGHVPGGAGCSCGLYGYYAIPNRYEQPVLEHVRDAEALATNYYQRVHVFGAFIGWGETTMHRKGIRSQYAKPVALRWSPLAESVAKSYPVKLCDTAGELRAAALEWGELIDAEEMLQRRGRKWADSQASGSGGLGLFGFTTGGYVTSSFKQNSAYRGIAEQARLWMAEAPLAKRVNVTLVLGNEASLQIEEGFAPFQKKVRIGGLDDKVWVVRSLSEKGNPHSARASTPARRMIEVDLEAVLPDNVIDYELSQLTKIGTLFKVEHTAHMGPVPSLPGTKALPGTSNHGAW